MLVPANISGPCIVSSSVFELSSHSCSSPASPPQQPSKTRDLECLPRYTPVHLEGFFFWEVEKKFWESCGNKKKLVKKGADQLYLGYIYHFNIRFRPSVNQKTLFQWSKPAPIVNAAKWINSLFNLWRTPCQWCCFLIMKPSSKQPTT